MKIRKLTTCGLIALFIATNTHPIRIGAAIRSAYNTIKKPVKTLAYATAGAISTSNALIAAYAIKTTVQELSPSLITQFMLKKNRIRLITYALTIESFFSLFAAYVMFKKTYETARA